MTLGLPRMSTTSRTSDPGRLPSGTGTETPHHPVGIGGAESSMAATSGCPSSTSTSKKPSRTVSGNTPMGTGRQSIAAVLTSEPADKSAPANG